MTSVLKLTQEGAVVKVLPSDIAFTPAVKAIQERKGSRKVYV